MCDPVTAAIVVGVTSVASTGASLIAQSSAAKAQRKAIVAQHAQVTEENRIKATTEKFDQMRAARVEQGRIRTAAGEAGLSLGSGTVEALLFDSAMQSELASDRTMANLESRQRQADLERTSMLSQAQGPSLLSAGLQLGSAAASGWSGVQGAKLATKVPSVTGATA